jgi:iron complex outermembrane recepter protein
MAMKNLLTISVSLILAQAALVQITLAQTSSAQTTGTSDSQNKPATTTAAKNTAIVEVIITATHAETKLQETPIAITAVTSETLETRALTTTADLGNIVPNAVFRKSEGIFGPAVSVYLRGIGQTDPQFNGEPSVAYYIDDIYYPFLFGSQFDLLDLDHVEVLRGPQGTLFGRNSIAGAINMVSKKPSLTESTASVDLTIGAYDRRDLRASFSVPLTNTLAFGGSFVSKKRTGYQEMIDFTCQMFMNGTPQLAGTFPFQTPETTFAGGRVPSTCVIDHLGGEDTRALRGQLYWQPNDRVELSISGDYMDQNDEIPAEYIFETDYAQTTTRANFVTAADRFSIPGTPFRWDNRFETGDPYKTYDNYCDPFPAGTQITGNTYYTGSVFKGGKCYGNSVPLKNRGVQGKLVIGLTDSINLTAIAGRRNMDLRFGAASDGTVLNDSIIYHEFHEHHWNGELRLTGQHDLLDWSSGAFYYKGTAEHLGQPQGVRAGTQRFQVDHYDPKAWAAYSNAVVHLTKKLNVTGGVRYSDDQKGVDFNSLTDTTPPGQTAFVAAAGSTLFDINIASKRWDWKAGTDFKFNDNMMAYASAGSGYRLPGFNVRPTQPGQEGQTPGESLVSFEVGIKSELFDRRLKTNAAVFLMDFRERPAGYAGQEAQLTNDLTGVVAGNSTVIPGGPVGTSYETAFKTCRAYNATTDGPRNPAAGIGVACVARTYSYAVGGKIKGAEAEIDAEPIDNLLITGSMGYTQWDSDEGTRQTAIPEWTASAGMQYKFTGELLTNLLSGSITPRIDWFYNGPIAYSSQNAAYDQGGRSTFNGRISYRNDELDFDVSLGATNLFNKFYYYQKTIFRELGLPTNLGQPSAPREWYMTIKKRF